MSDYQMLNLQLAFSDTNGIKKIPETTDINKIKEDLTAPGTTFSHHPYNIYYVLNAASHKYAAENHDLKEYWDDNPKYQIQFFDRKLYANTSQMEVEQVKKTIDDLGETEEKRAGMFTVHKYAYSTDSDGKPKGLGVLRIKEKEKILEAYTFPQKNPELTAALALIYFASELQLFKKQSKSKGSGLSEILDLKKCPLQLLKPTDKETVREKINNSNLNIVMCLFRQLGLVSAFAKQTHHKLCLICGHCITRTSQSNSPWKNHAFTHHDSDQSYHAGSYLFWIFCLVPLQPLYPTNIYDVVLRSYLPYQEPEYCPPW